jgi:hypothetical protein
VEYILLGMGCTWNIKKNILKRGMGYSGILKISSALEDHSGIKMSTVSKWDTAGYKNTKPGWSFAWDIKNCLKLTVGDAGMPKCIP